MAAKKQTVEAVEQFKTTAGILKVKLCKLIANEMDISEKSNKEFALMIGINESQMSRIYRFKGFDFTVDYLLDVLESIPNKCGTTQNALARIRLIS